MLTYCNKKIRRRDKTFKNTLCKNIIPCFLTSCSSDQSLLSFYKILIFKYSSYYSYKYSSYYSYYFLILTGYSKIERISCAHIYLRRYIKCITGHVYELSKVSFYKPFDTTCLAMFLVLNLSRYP